MEVDAISGLVVGSSIEGYTEIVCDGGHCLVWQLLSLLVKLAPEFSGGQGSGVDWGTTSGVLSG